MDGNCRSSMMSIKPEDTQLDLESDVSIKEEDISSVWDELLDQGVNESEHAHHVAGTRKAKIAGSDASGNDPKRFKSTMQQCLLPNEQLQKIKQEDVDNSISNSIGQDIYSLSAVEQPAQLISTMNPSVVSIASNDEPQESSNEFLYESEKAITSLQPIFDGKYFKVLSIDGNKIKCFCTVCNQQLSALTNVSTNLFTHLKHKHAHLVENVQQYVAGACKTKYAGSDVSGNDPNFKSSAQPTNGSSTITPARVQTPPSKTKILLITGKKVANSVTYLKSINFSTLTYYEKVQIKVNGRPKPQLTLEEIGISRNKEYRRKFDLGTYDKHDWLCGCEQSNSLFCFPCLLFGGDNEFGRRGQGVGRLKNLQPKITKHQNNQIHLNNVLDLSILGKVNTLDQLVLSEGRRKQIDRHNESVKQNRAVLSKIIDCILFCGKFELPLHAQDESNSYENPGIFRGLIDFACKSDPIFESRFHSATTFKDISKPIQNELLDSMLHQCQFNIKQEIENADFLAVMCDETIDIHNQSQISIVFRYEVEGKLVERFWGFFNPPNLTGEALSKILLDELNNVLVNKDKLIALTYDGAAAIRGEQRDVQSRIKEVYKNAHYVHCYAHKLNLVIEKATSKISKARIFFSNLSGITEFFSKSFQRIRELDKLSHRIPQPFPTRWNLKIRPVNAVYERKEHLFYCCTVLKTLKSKATGLAASNIIRMLKDPEFNFWLEFFNKVMPQVEILFSNFQSRSIDIIFSQVYIKSFTVSIESIKQQYKILSEAISTEEDKDKIERTLSNANEALVATEVCDVIIEECTKRFTFNDHLEANKLLHRNYFESYLRDFPSAELERTVESYPMLDKLKLKTELSVLYGRNRHDIYSIDKLTNLLNVLIDNNLEKSFSEIVKLVKILLTTPMTFTETERSFSTLKRIKTCLRNSMSDDRLTALSMISMEKEMITNINNFNENVIDHFATSKTRKMDLIFQ